MCPTASSHPLPLQVGSQNHLDYRALERQRWFLRPPELLWPALRSQELQVCTSVYRVSSLNTRCSEKRKAGHALCFPQSDSMRYARDPPPGPALGDREGDCRQGQRGDRCPGRQHTHTPISYSTPCHSTLPLAPSPQGEATTRAAVHPEEDKRNRLEKAGTV